MFEDLGRALEANQRKREAAQPVTVTERSVSAAPAAVGVPTARFADVSQPPTARFPDAVPPGVQQAAPLTVASGPQPRPAMTPDQAALASQLDAMGNQVASGIRGAGPAVSPLADAGVSPADLDALRAQATRGMGGPAVAPQVQPVDTSGLDAYARMMRAGYQ